AVPQPLPIQRGAEITQHDTSTLTPRRTDTIVGQLDGTTPWRGRACAALAMVYRTNQTSPSSTHSPMTGGATLWLAPNRSSGSASIRNDDACVCSSSAAEPEPTAPAIPPDIGAPIGAAVPAPDEPASPAAPPGCTSGVPTESLLAAVVALLEDSAPSSRGCAAVASGAASTPASSSGSTASSCSANAASSLRTAPLCFPAASPPPTAASPPARAAPPRAACPPPPADGAGCPGAGGVGSAETVLPPGTGSEPTTCCAAPPCTAAPPFAAA